MTHIKIYKNNKILLPNIKREEMKKDKEKLSNAHIANWQKELKKIERGEKYLDSEKRKLIDQKEKIRIKIKKEKEILRLENRIRTIRKKKWL